MSDQAFTLIFDGDIRRFKLNPLTTETPFGIPYGAGVGDAFGELDCLRELLNEALDSRASDYADAAHPGWSERVNKALGKP